MNEPPPSYSQVYPTFKSSGFEHQEFSGFKPGESQPYPQSYGFTPTHPLPAPLGQDANVMNGPPRPKRPLWFKVCKLYIIITNVFTFSGFFIMAIGFSFLSVLSLLSGHALVFLFCALLTTFVGLMLYYTYRFPIRGALQEISRNLIVHGIVRALFLLSHFIDRSVYAMALNQIEYDQTGQRLKADYTRKISYSLIFSGILEVMACFTIGFRLHNEEMERNPEESTGQFYSEGVLVA